MEKRHIFAALDRCHSNRTQAAKILGISVRTLRNKLNEYNGRDNSAASEGAEEETAGAGAESEKTTV